LLDPASKERGFKNIVKALNNSKIDKTYVIIVGGNGSFTSIIEDMIKSKIEFSTLIFGMLPFGTSNDLAKVLNWGSYLPKSLKNSIRLLTKEILEGQIDELDIWKIKLDMADCGEVIKYSQKSTKNLIGSTKFSKLMGLYFSIGQDARIGLDFGKNRANTRCANKFRYFWEATKKFFCKRTRKIKDTITNVVKVNREGEIEDNERGNHQNFIEEVMFATSKDQKANTFLSGNPASLLFSNIPSYLNHDQWEGGKG
jgi:hypothetical protein